MTHRSPLPEVFRERLAALEEVAYTARPTDRFHRCFGCGPAHPNGLHVRCFRTERGVIAPVVVPRLYEGPPGTVHGGIVATYLDEILGATCVRSGGRAALTGELTVRYVRPVPLETPLLGHGWLVTDHGKYLDVEACLEAHASGLLLASARGRFFPVKD